MDAHVVSGREHRALDASEDVAERLRKAFDRVSDFEAMAASREARPARTLLPEVVALLDATVASVEALSRATLRRPRTEGQPEPPSLPATPAEVAEAVVLDLSSERRGLLAAEQATASWSARSACDAALSRMRTGLIALDAAVSASRGTSAALYDDTDLARALAVRAHYARFRAQLRPARLARGDEVRRLRAVGTAVAIMVGSDVFPSLRRPDRDGFLALQQRILEVLRARPEARTAQFGGARLWSDILGFGAMLAHVRQRAEIRAHDEQLFEALNVDGAARESAAQWVATQRDALLGMDDALDDLLLAGRSPELIRGALRRVAGMKTAGELRLGSERPEA